MRHFLTVALAALFLSGPVRAQDSVSGTSAAQDGVHQLAAATSLADLASMPAGSWLPYGRPWRDDDPGPGDNAGVDFASPLGAWNCAACAGQSVWVWYTRGPGDGGFNGLHHL